MSSNMIYLSAAARAALQGVQDTTKNLFKVNSRLNSGLKVQDVSDDPVAFFRARGLNTRSDVFRERKDGIDQALSAMDATLDGVDGMQKLLQQMKGMLNNMKSSSTTEEFGGYIHNIAEIMDQYDKLARDASYSGTNLISDTTAKLEVPFGVNRDHKISISGVHLLSERYVSNPPEKTFYNALRDKSLLDVLRHMTDADQISFVKGYTRLLGFGFSLFSHAKQGYGFGNRVDKFIDAIGEAAGTRGLMLENSAFDLLNLAKVIPSLGYSRAQAYLGEHHNYPLYKALALLGFANSVYTGNITHLHENQEILNGFLALAKHRHPNDMLKLRFEDQAALELADEGYRHNLKADILSETFRAFISLLYAPSDILEAPSRVVALEDIVKLFTYDNPVALAEKDRWFLHNLKQRLSLFKNGLVVDTRYFQQPSLYLSVLAWTNQRLYVRYEGLLRMIMGRGRSVLSLAQVADLDKGGIEDFEKLFATVKPSPIHLPISIFSLLRRAEIFTKHFSQIFLHKGLSHNYVANPQLFLNILGGERLTRPSQVRAYLRTMLAKVDTVFSFFSSLPALEAYLSQVIAGGPIENSILNPLLSFFSRMFVDSNRPILSRYLNGGNLAQFFERQDEYAFDTALFVNWFPSDLKLIKSYLEDFFENYLPAPMPVDINYDVFPNQFSFEKENIADIFQRMTKEVKKSLQNPGGLAGHSRMSLYGTGTTAMKVALDWLKKIDFQSIYQSGELSKEVQVATDNMEIAEQALEQQLARFGAVIDLLEIRLDFTEAYVQHLEMGAGKLVLADVNEEGAKMMSLQTRQQMAFKTLGIAGSEEQNILQLIR